MTQDSGFFEARGSVDFTYKTMSIPRLEVLGSGGKNKKRNSNGRGNSKKSAHTNSQIRRPRVAAPSWNQSKLLLKVAQSSRFRQLRSRINASKESENCTPPVGSLNTSTDVLKEKLADIADTLKSKDLVAVVEVPRFSSDVELWVAENTITFCWYIDLIHDMVEDFLVQVSSEEGYSELCETFESSGLKMRPFSNGFPQKMMYHIRGKDRKIEECSGANYVKWCLLWLSEQIENSRIFPDDEEKPFSSDFLRKYAPEMFKRIFRVFAIFFSVCWPYIAQQKLADDILMCFKHFYFFIRRHKLLKNSRELEAFKPLRDIVDLSKWELEYKESLEVFNWKGK